MVKPGYKETVIGILPEKWDFSELKNIFTRIEAGVSVNSDNTASSDYYVLKTSAVHNGTVDLSEIKPVIQADYSRLKCSLQGNSIIFSRMNTPDLVGECGYNAANVDNIFLPDRLWKICNTKPSQYNFQWLNYLLNTVNHRDAIRATATGTSNSMKNISKDRLLEIKIPVPPIDEQEKIAEALSDMDELIASLENLIAKKKAIKQGVIQELLTSKKRLPGFSKGWKTYKIGDIGTFYNGLTGKSKQDFDHGTSKYITFLNVLSNTVIDTSILESVDVSEMESQNPVKKGDLLFNTSSETPEEVGMCAAVNTELENTYLNSFCFGYRLNSSEQNSIFLSYYFNSFLGRNIMSTLAQGATRYNLSKSNFSEVNITVPSIHEQLAIASILSDMDSEISVLEQKLAKCRQTKQGMMQQLLTGKIRLV